MHSSRLAKWFVIVSFSLAFVAALGCSFLKSPPANVHSSKGVPNEDRFGCVEDRGTDNVIQSFRFPNRNTPILIELDILNCKYSFVIDTGSNACVYDKSFLPLLGDPVRFEAASTPNGQIRVPFYRSLGGKIGPILLDKDRDAACMDLSRLGSAVRRRIDGIIGMDYLKKYIFRIDLASNDFSFLRRIENDAGHKIDVVLRKDCPYVMVKLPGMRDEELFLVDLGCLDYGALQSKAFQDLIDRGFAQRIESQSFETAGGLVRVSSVILDEISVDIFTHKKLVFREGRQNILGLKFWSMYNVTFDFSHNAIYLKSKAGK